MKGWTHAKDAHDRNGKAIRHSLSAKGIKNKPFDATIHKNLVPTKAFPEDEYDRLERENPYKPEVDNFGFEIDPYGLREEEEMDREQARREQKAIDDEYREDKISGGLGDNKPVDVASEEDQEEFRAQTGYYERKKRYEELETKGYDNLTKEEKKEYDELNDEMVEEVITKEEEQGEYQEQDKISGGLGDNKPDEDFNKNKLKEGMTVESEHTDNVEVAKEIAKDHLTENPEYYKELRKVEEGLSKRERRFVNNFIMSSKDYDDYTNNMNWSQDVQSYGFKKLARKFGFYKDLVSKYGYLNEGD